MNRSVWTRLKQSLAAAEQWYRNTPERSLNEAYEAAQSIKRLEDQHTGGETIVFQAQGEGAVSTYLQTQINRHLKTIRMRLTEYRFCSPILEGRSPSPQPGSPSNAERSARTPPDHDERTLVTSSNALSTESYIDLSDAIVDLTQENFAKLQFIDSVLTRYEPWRLPTPDPLDSSPQSAVSLNGQVVAPALKSVQDSFSSVGSLPQDASTVGKNRFIPRSIFNTVDRFRREIDPNPRTEEEMVREFRVARIRTRAATRFILLLIIVPLLTQQISKAVLVGPIVDRLKGIDQVEVWVNPSVEERFLAEMVAFEDKLRYQSLFLPTVQSPEEVQQALRNKAAQLRIELQEQLREPIKNVFADLISLLVFAVLLVTGQQEIITLKAWMDELIYGLSDSAKAFIIILLTDVFVGFHSPHGWEVIMETIFEHVGLPLNRNVINMFIATFPVMLDTVFKYWIFKYLNQLSPSAVATYKNMNE